MLELCIKDETSPLESVLLGTALSPGPVPELINAYDPKSRIHIIEGTYPSEADMVEEMEGFAAVLNKHGVRVFRPEVLENCNQIFARDIAFVIDDKLIKANILPDREEEFNAIVHVLDRIDNDQILFPPDEVHVEGGDVMPWDNYIFVGTYTGADYPDYITARTNQEAVKYLQKQFPGREVKAFELRKSNTDPYENALHLDCCFQPIGRDKAIIHKNGFLNTEDYDWLVNYFGRDNVFDVTKEEMYEMYCNVFSISPEVVVSETGFKRLNDWMRSRGFTVEEIKYSEIGKQEGLLRCSTLPLKRVYTNTN